MKHFQRNSNLTSNNNSIATAAMASYDDSSDSSNDSNTSSNNNNNTHYGDAPNIHQRGATLQKKEYTPTTWEESILANAGFDISQTQLSRPISQRLLIA